MSKIRKSFFFNLIWNHNLKWIFSLLVVFLVTCQPFKTSTVSVHNIDNTHFKSKMTKREKIYYKFMYKNAILTSGSAFYFKAGGVFDFHACGPKMYSGRYEIIKDTIFIMDTDAPLPQKFVFINANKILGILDSVRMDTNAAYCKHITIYERKFN